MIQRFKELAAGVRYSEPVEGFDWLGRNADRLEYAGMSLEDQVPGIGEFEHRFVECGGDIGICGKSQDWK